MRPRKHRFSKFGDLGTSTLRFYRRCQAIRSGAPLENLSFRLFASRSLISSDPLGGGGFKPLGRSGAYAQGSAAGVVLPLNPERESAPLLILINQELSGSFIKNFTVSWGYPLAILALYLIIFIFGTPMEDSVDINLHFLTRENLNVRHFESAKKSNR